MKEDNRMKRFYKYAAFAVIAASLMGADQTVNAATGYQRLTHNAYAYNYNGQRVNHKRFE